MILNLVEQMRHFGSSLILAIKFSLSERIRPRCTKRHDKSANYIVILLPKYMIYLSFLKVNYPKSVYPNAILYFSFKPSCF